VAYFVLKSRCQEESTLSIEEVNAHLDIIANNNAKGKEGQRQVNTSIKHLLVNLSALQLKWLIRIILKDLKIGIKEQIILESFHDDAPDLYNFTSSLENVCATLADPQKRLHEVGVALFSPCRPMLGEKAKPNKIEELMNGQSFFIETKFDGERFQMHKSGDKYVFFSRNGHDYTETFGSDKYSGGSLTPFIHASFAQDVENLILDGEMCGYNIREKILLSLSEEYDVKSSNRRLEDLQTCFCVFDILLYNNTVLTNKPLKDRVEYIKKSFEEIEGRIVYSQRETASRNQDVVDALNKAIDKRLEGIVVKDPNSVYKPSVRNGSGWFKVKPDYMLGLNDDLDLIIVGGYYGSGKRSGLLSHFLLAVAFDDANSNAETRKKPDLQDTDGLDLEGNDEHGQDLSVAKGYEPNLFYSFCKIGSGYTFKELVLIFYNYFT
jgi:DNA ligase-4